MPSSSQSGGLSQRQLRRCRDANFALADEFAHRAHGVFDRHGRIDTMDVVEVNDIGLEPLETALAAPFDIFRPPIRGWRAVRCTQIAKLAGDHVIVAMVLYRVGNQLLVAALAVGVRAVEKIDADLARMAQGIDRRISVGLVVK